MLPSLGGSITNSLSPMTAEGYDGDEVIMRLRFQRRWSILLTFRRYDPEPRGYYG
jgi:hypothetical protein